MILKWINKIPQMPDNVENFSKPLEEQDQTVTNDTNRLSYDDITKMMANPMSGNSETDQNMDQEGSKSYYKISLQKLTK